MPQEIILPITNLASAGLVEDAPAVSLPPNVFQKYKMFVLGMELLKGSLPMWIS